MNITEKILANASGLRKVEPEEIIEVRVDLAMAHDGTSPPTIKTFYQISDKVWDPNKIVLVFDHNLPANNMAAAEFQRITRNFAKDQGIENIYTHGEGICHQVLPERGYIKPGTVVVGADSHTCTYGAFGAFATGIGATDMAIVFASGETWFMVPAAYKINVNGVLRNYVTAKDVILYIIGQIGSYGATYKSLEFCGSTVEDMNVAERMTMCNMAVESGAKNGIMEPNQATLHYLKERKVLDSQLFRSDGDAFYEKEYNFSVDDLQPQIACPNNVDNVYPVSRVVGKSIDQAFIGSCTNGRLEDLRLAAQVLKDEKVHQDIRLIISPASQAIYLDALDEGLMDIFLRSGAIVINPSCGPCLGAHMGVLTSGEVCLATTNRNFVGRMGDPKSEVYLANPAVVAYSAIKGEIRDPSEKNG
jgi:methanogen homoaconitase large subunit